jgi:hypothetical protein
VSLHDAYARRTPVEMAFPEWDALEALARSVDEEASRGSQDSTDFEGFLTLSAVGDAVRDLTNPDVPSEAAMPMASLLYQAVHFLRAGSPLYLLETGVVRWLASHAPEATEPPAAPARSGYVQFPQHLLWARSTASRADTESIDGAFWTLTSSGLLHVLAVSGVVPDRPGFGALPLPAAPLSDAAAWLGASARDAGRDFASSLPGAELDGLYSIETAGELLKLLGRFFVLASGPDARMDPRPGRTQEAAAQPRPAGAPPCTRLPYTRVSLGD